MTINWKSYYKDEQISDYNLSNYKDNDIEIKLFNTNDLYMGRDNQINYLNPYLGELPMMYYIYKNNLKSDYIVISQYRRDITYIDYEQLDKDKIQVIYLWDENNDVKLKDRLLQYRDPSGEIKEILWKYFKEHFSLSDEEITNIQNKKSYKCMSCFVWAMNWKIYCKLCEFIFGFLDKLFPNEEWKNVNNILTFRDNQKKIYYELYKDKYDWVFDNNRYLTFIIEDTLSVVLNQFFDLFGNNKYWDETYIVTYVNKYDTICDVAKFYKLNIKCNPFNIFVKCIDDKSYEEFYDFFISKNNWQFNKIKILRKDETYDNRAIRLMINQYIDVNKPIDLQNNKFNIKNIMQNMKITIWCSYHNNEQIQDYKLNELNQNIYKLYDTTSFSDPNFNKYFSEFTTMYNVWKNNIKSDVIGFCHYRRFFDLSTVNFNEIYNKNEIYGIDELSGGYGLDNKNKEWPFCREYSNIVYDTFLDFLKEKNVPLKKSYEYYKTNLFCIYGGGCYLLRYDTFYYLADVLFNYLNEILFKNFINDHNVIYNNQRPDRTVGYIMEQLFGFLIRNNNYNNSVIKSNIINHAFTYILKTGDLKEIDYLKKLYISNIKIGFKKFYVVTNNIVVNNWNLLDQMYLFNYIKIVNSLNDIKDDNFIILT